MDIGFTWAEARDVLLAVVKAAFLPEAERKVLIAEFEAELDATAAKLGLDWGASESGAAAAVEAQAKARASSTPTRRLEAAVAVAAGRKVKGSHGITGGRMKNSTDTSKKEKQRCGANVSAQRRGKETDPTPGPTHAQRRPTPARRALRQRCGKCRWAKATRALKRTWGGHAAPHLPSKRPQA